MENTPLDYDLFTFGYIVEGDAFFKMDATNLKLELPMDSSQRWEEELQHLFSLEFNSYFNLTFSFELLSFVKQTLRVNFTPALLYPLYNMLYLSSTQ